LRESSENQPSPEGFGHGFGNPLGIDCHNYATGSETLGSTADKNTGPCTAAVLIDTLSHPALRRFLDIVEVPDPAADCKRNEYVICGFLDNIEDDFFFFHGCGYIQKYEFIRAFGVIIEGVVDRIAGIPEIRKLTPLTTLPSLTSRQGIILFANIYPPIHLSLSFRSSIPNRSPFL